jgi:Helix-turn-helix domain
MTKKKQIENHLKRRTPITSFQAFTLYAVTRLAAVIFKLRQEGWKIESVDRKATDGTVYAEYYYISHPIKKQQ